MKGYVYQLVCPIKNNPIYIGATKKAIKNRLAAHISMISNSKLPLYVYLRENNIIPNIEILQTVEYCLLKITEKKWMHVKISEGFSLFNVRITKNAASGSVKIDTEVYHEVAEYCENNGLKITFFATEAMREKLEKIKTFHVEDANNQQHK